MGAIGNNVETALVLLAYGADPSERYHAWTALHYAVKARQTGARQAELVRALLDAGAPVDAQKEGTLETPLMLAASTGYTTPDVLKVLLRYGADINAIASQGRTAEDRTHWLLDQDEIWRARGLNVHHFRTPGVAEDNLALLREVRAAGGWKRYVAEPRKHLLVLRKLAERGRARPPRGRQAKAPTGLFGRDLPDVLFWKVLSFWKTPRDV